METARRRLAFDEVFLAQLMGLAQKRDWKSASAKYFRLSDEQMSHWVAGFPYQLTNAQWKVLNEIRGDIDSGKPMNRLIQEKIRKARSAIVNQKMRMVKCPYCGHNAIAVFEDSRGHIQAKCKACGRETVFDVINMRRLYLRLHRR